MNSKMMIGFLFLYMSTHAQGFDEIHNPLYFDSTINPTIYKIRQLDPSIHTVNGYTLLSKDRFDLIIHNTRIKRVFVNTTGGKRELFKTWEMDDDGVTDKLNKNIKYDDIKSIEIQEKVRISRLVWMPLTVGVFLGLMPTLWEGVGYLFDRHFDKNEVLSFYAAGFVLGIAASFSRDKLTIHFQQDEEK